MTTPSATGPPDVAQRLGAGLVLLGPQGVVLVARLLETGARVAAREGVRLPPQAAQLWGVLETARSGSGTTFHARAGTSEPAAHLSQAPSAGDVADVQEVAQVLAVSREYASRLLRAGTFETGRKVAGRWQVDRLELQTWRDDRQEARTA